MLGMQLSGLMNQASTTGELSETMTIGSWLLISTISLGANL